MTVVASIIHEPWGGVLQWRANVRLGERGIVSWMPTLHEARREVARLSAVLTGGTK